MADYFRGQIEELSLKVKSSESGNGLRECQIGAYWATKAHFTAYEGPALISLPTGAGKTALMMLLAFGLEAKRVLVITPTDVLRTQTAGKFESLDGLVQAGVVSKDFDKPSVHRQTARVTSAEVWEEIEACDVVVALPQNVSPEYNREDLEDIVPPPEGFFDLVFFDEAHHTRAPSWGALLQEFNAAKCVLMTATPFRRDRRRIPAHLVYFYPLHKAIAAGIYHPVEFHPVVSPSEAQRDTSLCEKAVVVLSSLGQEHKVKMLIRTDRIEKALELEALYESRGVHVEAVHSKRTPLQNEVTLQKLEEGDLDGVVAVGQLGEGLDIPALKIAVFHEPPKSFPFTVQLVGRITRPTDDKGPAGCVIADPEQLRSKGIGNQVRRLYHEDQAWKELVPQLVEEFAKDVLSDITPGSSEILAGVQFADLAPYLSARLYRINEEQISFDTDIDLGDEFSIYRLPHVEHDGFLGVITETSGRPTWARKSALDFEVYDLHLFHYHAPSQTLFVFTTSEAVGSQILEQVVDGGIDRLGGDKLVRVMHSDQDLDYMVAGLANAFGPSGALPSYKMFLGHEVQGAINPSDARVFVRGHVVARFNDGETRGISDRQGRVWSMKRTSIQDFMDWCDHIGSALTTNAAIQVAKGLEAFGTPKRQMHFSDKPLQIIMNPKTVVYSMSLEETDLGLQRPQLLDSPHFEVGEFLEEDKRAIQVTLHPSDDADGIELVYNIERNEWACSGAGEYIVEVDDGEHRETPGIGKFLSEYPPYFYLPTGSVIIGGHLYTVPHKYATLRSECLVEGLDWTECDIRVEYAGDTEEEEKLAQEGKITVQAWVEKRLISEHSEGVIVFKDHGRGEIADYIQMNDAEKIISLYHVKAAPKYSSGPNQGEANIGTTLGHVQAALDQVLRSVTWVKSKRLVGQITKRNAATNESRFIIGEEAFDGLEAGFVPASWSYRVYLVNPGLDLQKIAATENVNLLLLTCYEWLRGIGTDLRIMGYDSSSAD